MPRLTETETRAALERVDPELRRLLLWLIGGSADVARESARNGLS